MGHDVSTLVPAEAVELLVTFFLWVAGDMRKGNRGLFEFHLNIHFHYFHYFHSTEMAPLTLFLFEEATSINFRLENKTYIEMQEAGFTIKTILQTLDLTDESNKYNFFLFGGLNRKATRVVDNPGLISCYESHNNEPVITIIVRHKSDPSPYYAQAPSAMRSLSQRQALSGIQALENPILNPESSDAESSIGNFLNPLNEVIGVWNLEREITKDREAHLEKIFDAHPYLKNNVQLFIQNLKQCCKTSRSRLKSASSIYFLGKPYFSDQAVSDILAIPLFPSTLKERLDKHSEDGFSVCPCLVSIFLRAFNWTWKSIEHKSLSHQSINTEPNRRYSKALMTIQNRVSKFNLKISV